MDQSAATMRAIRLNALTIRDEDPEAWRLLVALCRSPAPVDGGTPGDPGQATTPGDKLVRMELANRGRRNELYVHEMVREAVLAISG